VADATLLFEPIVVTGRWRVTVATRGAPLDAALVDETTGLMPDGVHTSNHAAGRDGPARSIAFWQGAPSAGPIRLALRVRLGYEPPQQVRTFRLPSTLHGHPAAVGWRVTVEGWCAVEHFPDEPARDSVTGGFPVVLASSGYPRAPGTAAAPGGRP
jgi:hypothetical protein